MMFNGLFGRRVHRWVGTVAFVFLAIVAFSGLTLQMEMMKAVPGARSPGGQDYQGAAAFSDKEVLEMVRTTLAAARRTDSLSNTMELSLLLGARQQIGTVTMGSATPHTYRFDARTGEIAAEHGDESRAFHLFLLRIHRGDILGVPGLWLSIACGIALLTLCITGAWVYLDLLRRRLHHGQTGWFWK